MFVASVWIVTRVASLDRSEKSVVPAGTGPVQTGPTETGPTEVSGVALPVSIVGPVPGTNYMLDLNTGETLPPPNGIVALHNISSAYAPSPDGSKIAYVGRDQDGDPQIFVANLDGTGVEQVTNGDVVAAVPGWSPDSSKLAYVGRGGDHTDDDVFVLDLATGESTQITFAGHAEAPSFSPDGESVVYTDFGDPEQIWIVPVTGGESALFVDYARYGRFSPDGSLLVYVCVGPDFEELCLAKSDGTRITVLGGGEDVVAASWSPDGTRIAYWEFHSLDVFVIDPATDEETYVTDGVYPVWVDDHTLLMRPDRCPGLETCEGISGPQR